MLKRSVYRWFSNTIPRTMLETCIKLTYFLIKKNTCYDHYNLLKIERRINNSIY